MSNAIRLLDLFRYYKGEPHQMAAIAQLEAEIRKANQHILGRNQSWYSTWTQAGKTPEPAWLQPALTIIKEFEGCRLVAYKCPAGVWTIGWGTTRLIDRPVQQGDTISQQLADELLQNEVEITARKVLQLLAIAKDWSGNRIAALVSLAYNIGLSAFADSSLVRRLQDREDPNAVASEEFPRWNKADGKELAGLTRRRAAELSLFLSGAIAKPTRPQSELRNNPLKVPYFSQRDSQIPGQAARMCFSSSCAMLLATLRPTAISGPNADDQYLKRLQSYGDSTEAGAQLKTLSSFGVNAKFIATADWANIERQIDRGIPVPCGFLHHGPISKPSGGGHWLCVIGYTATHVIVNDPWGEADLINGGPYLNSKGSGLAYSRKNWGRRWQAEGPRSGWAIIADR